ncbi:hypothetical protein SOV_39830 [Sporomusa ovata DSM 2662]|nr:hypothetical protein SOV_3c02440 [Sporomusa ovata DSM 2662]
MPGLSGLQQGSDVMAEVKKTVRELWQNYALLTQEIAKFISKRDWDLVSELLSQREKLQFIIEAAPEDGYKVTNEGQETLQSIRMQNQSIIVGLQRLYNNAQRNQQVSQAYEQVLDSYSGAFMDRHS